MDGWTWGTCFGLVLIKENQSNFQQFDDNCDTTMHGMWKVCIKGHDALGLPLSNDHICIKDQSPNNVCLHLSINLIW
jgi:hypothetical protein